MDSGSIPQPYVEICEQARQQVLEVADSPDGRYQLCTTFYQRYGYGGGTGFGSSELEFIKWEIDRGVLNSLQSAQPGSQWWRAVNAGLLWHAACAAALHEADPDAQITGPIKYWMAYLRAPSPQSWYRAHNASTVDGYLLQADAAHLETEAERTFINIVLYRVLYAQALVEGDAPGLLGFIAHHFLPHLLGDMEQLIANPRSPSVDILLNLPDFYPRHYPLTPQDQLDILSKGHGAENLAQVMLDKVLVSPCLTTLYRLASDWLGMPALVGLVVNNRPVYPDFDPSR